MTNLSSTSSIARVAAPAAVAVAAMIAFTGCSGGGGSSTSSAPGTSGDFVVLGTEPSNNGFLFLNDSVAIDFSNTVDIASADLNTFSFSVFDLNGNPLSEQPQGTFRLDTSPGDANAGRRLTFSPRFPRSNTFTDGGFKPGRRYLVSLPAGANVTSINDASQRKKPLRAPVSFEFRTAAGSTPIELFRDTKPGGPRRAGFSVSQSDNTGVASLSLLGGAAVEIRLEFDQPLNPSTENLPLLVNADPTKRTPDQKGQIYLEYDHDGDQDPNDREWIPATVELERNSLDGATVVLRPIGILPNNTDVFVIVDKSVQDMSGESNENITAFQSEFGRFSTAPALEPQYDAIVEQFLATSNTVDFEAPILDPIAGVSGGKLVSQFAFDGQASTLDYEPEARETVLDTSFTTVQPVGSAPINVAGGIFKFRNVNIPVGKTVRGIGPNPMVWLVTGDFEVSGTLQVNGGDGARVDVLNSANFPTGNGIGLCGGGNGGKGSPRTGRRSGRGESGFGPDQIPGVGGRGGRYACPYSTDAFSTAPETGGGGGGGSFATEGDPEFNSANGLHDQWQGVGGESQPRGGVGGNPGDLAFRDSRADNNFWGAGVNVHLGIRIQGELLAPRGGSGGGGGGDRAAGCSLGAGGFINDQKGGGGGAGGGVLIIQALGRVIVRGSGSIEANGGHGGGGEQAGSNNAGGGGGGGSGGMIVIMAGEGVQLTRHGGPYANGNNNFAITADGGIGLQGDFDDLQITGKYGGTAYPAANQVNQATGGFGGMGLVQIMVPPGDDSLDGTGSLLDDRIEVVQGSGSVSVEDKISTIAWRGWPDGNGVMRDDFGVEIDIDDDGDIRPAPILLPLQFGPASRAQSRWIDLGAVRRTPGVSGPGVVDANPAPMPDFEFDGVITSGPDAGYVTWQGNSQVVPEVLAPVAFSSFQTGVTFEGQSAYQFKITSAALAAQPDDRYTHYRAEFLDDNGNRLTDLRILGHSNTPGTNEHVVFVEPTIVFPPDATRVRVIAKFFNLATNNVRGIGPVIGARPQSNVRIGFAFHADPTGADPDDRFPALGFSANVSGPGGLLEQMAAADKRPALVKWDVFFDQRFDNPDLPLQPAMPTQSLDYLVLPFRF